MSQTLGLTSTNPEVIAEVLAQQNLYANAEAEEERVQTGSFNREEVVALAKTDLNFFASLLMPTIFTLFFPALHISVWGTLLEKLKKCETISGRAIEDKFPQIAIGWPRGQAKTTLVKLFILWCIFFSSRKFILIVCSNSQKAENILADVCDMLAENNIKALFGDYRSSIEIARTDLKKFSFMGKEITLAALGSGGDPRGLNLKNERPDMIVMDDMQAKENSDSPTQSKGLLSWMTSTLAKSKSPHGCMFIYIGNMFSSHGCILKILKGNPNWHSIIVPGILSDGEALWPELRSKEELLDELRNDIAMGTPENFFAEIMNDPDSGVSSCFDVTKVPHCPYVGAGLDLPAASFLIIDVAADKIGSDDTTIIRYEVFDGKPVAREILAGTFSPGETIQKSLLLCLQHGIPAIAVESVAYQSSILYWFQQMCLKHGIEGLHLVEVFPNGRPKNSRILTMFKALLSGDLYLDDSIRAKVFWEATQFKPAQRRNDDNIIDNLAYAEDVMQTYPELILNHLSVESREMESAEVCSFNSAF